MNNDYNNQDYNNQNYNQYPNYNNQQYNSQYPTNNNYTPADAKSDQTKMILGIVFLALGWFIAGIIFGTGAIIMSTQIKKKSGGKTAILVLGIIEVIITIIGVIAGIVLNVLGTTAMS